MEQKERTVGVLPACSLSRLEMLCASGRGWGSGVYICYSATSAVNTGGLLRSNLLQKVQQGGYKGATMRMGEAVGRGYVEEDFQEVFRRYIPMSEVQELREELAGRTRNPSPEGT